MHRYFDCVRMTAQVDNQDALQDYSFLHLDRRKLELDQDLSTLVKADVAETSEWWSFATYGNGIEPIPTPTYIELFRRAPWNEFLTNEILNEAQFVEHGVRAVEDRVVSVFARSLKNADASLTGARARLSAILENAKTTRTPIEYSVPSLVIDSPLGAAILATLVYYSKVFALETLPVWLPANASGGSGGGSGSSGDTGHARLLQRILADAVASVGALTASSERVLEFHRGVRGFVAARVARSLWQDDAYMEAWKQELVEQYSELVRTPLSKPDSALFTEAVQALNW
jgi:hypothetical protein